MAGTSSVTGDQTIFSIDNITFDQTNRGPSSTGAMYLDGQLWIGSTASNLPNNGGHVRLGTIVSPLGTLAIGYVAPNITVDLAGTSTGVDSFAMQAGTSPVVPDGAGLVTFNGATVAAGTNPVRTNGTGANTMALQVQIASAVAAADATRIGLASFDSDIFTVDADGFVSTSGGTLVQSITGGPGITITGTAAAPIVNSVIFTDTAATTLAVDNGYFATAAGTYDMPATAAQGELIEIVCDTAGAVVLDCPANNFIRIGNQITSSGGTVTSTGIGDSLKLRYRLSSLTWYAVSSMGNWTLA